MRRAEREDGYYVNGDGPLVENPSLAPGPSRDVRRKEKEREDDWSTVKGGREWSTILFYKAVYL